VTNFNLVSFFPDNSEHHHEVSLTENQHLVEGSAFIVPSSTLQKVKPPSLDSTDFQPNISASIGRTAYLRCKVKHLGHKSVSNLWNIFFLRTFLEHFFFEIFRKIQIIFFSKSRNFFDFLKNFLDFFFYIFEKLFFEKWTTSNNSAHAMVVLL
jgi:hypothetical protein